MHNTHWLKLPLAGLVFAAFLAAPGLPLPGADRLGFAGTAAAQETIDIDTFYDELGPYGQWVWHPRFGYVWLPEDVSPRWRPYTIGRWTYTDEYGWYWDSHEPFAWAVYHYGRWGYDQDYGWFWVPGDTWAPAWVQWRYSDDYVGWAPVGPSRAGYAYGVPVNYDPPVAESWVFVQPRYMTSRAISHYAVPIGGLGVAFFAATNVYRPIYRGGIVYNYGMPRDTVVKIIKRPIYVQKVYKVDNWKGGRFDDNGPNKGIKIYAPNFSRNNKPNDRPKKFVDDPRDFKPKAKLKETYNGDVPKGWGRSAKGVTPIAKEEPDAFKKKHDFEGGRGEQFGDRGNDKDRDQNRDRDNNKGEAKGNEPPPIDKVIRQQDKGGKEEAKGTDTNPDAGKPKFGDQDNRNNDKGKPKGFGQGNQGGSNQFKQGNRDQGDQGGGDQRKQKNFDTPGGANQFKQGNRDQGNQGGGDQRKQKNFGAPGGPDQFKQGNREQDDRGGAGKGKQKNFGAPSGPDGFNQFKQGNRDQGDQGGGGQGRQRGPGGGGPEGSGGSNQFKQGGGGGGGGRAQGNQGAGGGGDNDKCKKHPEKCQN